MLAKTTGPEPGTPTASSTSSPAVKSAHHADASASARGPETSSRAASPQATMPSPRRTQESAAVAGRSSRSGPVESVRTVVTVRAAACGEVRAAAVTIPPRCARRGRARSGLCLSASSQARPPPQRRRLCSAPAVGDRRDHTHTAGVRAGLDKRPADVAAMFDRVARRYDVTNTVLSAGLDASWRRATRDALAAHPGQTVLDVAAGTAVSTVELAAGGVRAIACDFSQGMLRAGAARPVPKVAGDAMALPLAD